MRKWLLLLGLLLPSIASAQGVGNVVLKHYPGNPSGGCSANQMALNDSNGDLSICHNGMWMDVGGGGGGGISGTISSPFVSYACAPDMLCDTGFSYYPTGADPSSYCNFEMGAPCLQAIESGEGTVSLSPDQINFINVMDGNSRAGLGPSGLQVNGDTVTFLPDCTYGSGGMICVDASAHLAANFSPPSLTLGVNGGSGGSLTLNDATMGSVGISTDSANPFVGASFEFSNTNMLGSAQLDMALFPDDPNTDVYWSLPGMSSTHIGWFIGPTTVKTIADIVDVNTTTLNPDTTGFPCGPMGLGDGQIAHFSDGDTNVWGAVLAGGGALFVEAYCDGNNWLVMGAAASTGPLSATTYSTATNCVNGAAPAVCGSAAAGHVAVPTGSNPTLVVNTSRVTANSEILLTVDESSTISGITCNTTLSTLPAPVVTARTPATSFTIQVNATLLTNPACIGYSIVN